MVRTHPSKVAICIIEKEEKKNWMFPIKNYQNKNKIIIIKKKKTQSSHLDCVGREGSRDWLNEKGAS